MTKIIARIDATTGRKNSSEQVSIAVTYIDIHVHIEKSFLKVTLST